MAAHKGGFSKEEKAEIIRLYTVEHRGKKYIGSLFGRSDYNIAYWLVKWGVGSISRSDISKTIRQVYGATPGFVVAVTRQPRKNKSPLLAGSHGEKAIEKQLVSQELTKQSLVRFSLWSSQCYGNVGNGDYCSCSEQNLCPTACYLVNCSNLIACQDTVAYCCRKQCFNILIRHSNLA